MQKFESIPTDTIWLLEVAGDLEKSDGRTKIQDTRRHKKNKNRSHEGLFVIFVGFKNTSLAFIRDPNWCILVYILRVFLGYVEKYAECRFLRDQKTQASRCFSWTTGFHIFRELWGLETDKTYIAHDWIEKVCIYKDISMFNSVCYFVCSFYYVKDKMYGILNIIYILKNSKDINNLWENILKFSLQKKKILNSKKKKKN